MPIGIEEPARSYWLCQYCDNVARQLRAVLKTGEDHDFRAEHYPNLQAFIDGILGRRCHLCSVFVGNLATKHSLGTVEIVLQKLDEYRDKADRPLLIDVPIKHSTFSRFGEPEDENEGHLDVCSILLGYDEGRRQLQRVISVALTYHSGGMGRKNVSLESLSTFTGSDQTCALIRRWLHTCSMEHKDCHTNSMQRTPTRLLDLGISNTEDVRLVDGSNIGHAPYAALSYCWGSVPQLVLLPETQSEFKRRVKFHSLSKVAQDAATFCRSMSVRYLWIDAMCIMQGPDGDFQQEAARMEEVYAGALFIICAAASTDTTQPFLVHRDPLWWTQCHLFDEESGRSRGYISAHYCESNHDAPGNFNLDHRGWCFQEQFLSPRSVYFGRKNIHWVCRKATVCERYPNFEGSRGVQSHDGSDWESPKQLYKELVSLGDDISEPETNVPLRRVWDEIRQMYSSTKLTYQSDKLMALAGVASVIERKFNARASFGLWLNFLLHDLLWVHFTSYSTESEKRVRLDIAPSWSWANLGCCIISGTFHLETPNEGGMWPTRRVLNSVSATVVSLPCVTGFAVSLPSVSTRTQSPIRLRGRLTACVPSRQSNRRLNPVGFPSEPTQRGMYYPDIDSQETEFYCFLVMREYRVFLDSSTGEDSDVGDIRDSCLVLTPVSGAKHRFRRIGTYFDYSQRYEARELAQIPVANMHMFRGVGEEQEIEII